MTRADTPAPAPTTPGNEDSLAGFGFALAAYLFWGFLPLFMKLVAHISPAEVVAHRILWSVPIAGTVLVLIGRTADLRRALASPKMVMQAALTAALVSVNWGIYVWAIFAERALDAALGYYINPLFSVFLGAVLLGEKLRPLQMAAIGLAACAVALLTWEAGSLPWVALALATTWGFYAFFRKTLPIGPNQGFTLEVLILSLPALAYVLWLEAQGQGHFLRTGLRDTLLLLGCGAVTALPLMVYANAAKRLRMSTIGMMQYIAPTMIFLLAIFVFKEPFASTRFVAFGLIWAALGLYSISMLANARARSAA